MAHAIKHLVIVGGGTAGWITAALVASAQKSHHPEGLKVTLVEASDIPSVGVGEGTWPTMKNTLQQVGIPERDFFKFCHATFKQGGKFVNWARGDGDFYYHPFNVPLGYERLDLAPYLDRLEDYAAESNFQHHVCEAGCAPRSLAEGEYQGQCNYAYHLDAGAFAEFMKHHCTQKLGVQHRIDTVREVVLADNGDIERLDLTHSGALAGDLFVDCTGFASRLLGQALGVEFKSADSVLGNNRALAIQVPYPEPDAPIACHTIATAQPVGWTWDIGLTHRRGVGYVYSTDFISDDRAERVLRDHIGPAAAGLEARSIPFTSGHRTQWWKNNCVAVGLSAGFVEPLEATAIMLVELSGRFLANHMPADREVMAVMAARFNRQMDYRWRRIIDFLKLHYMLSQRPEPYWQWHRESATIPDSLREDLLVWRQRGPIVEDFDSALELFPAASYQYVLYGMGFSPRFADRAHLHDRGPQARQLLARNRQLAEQMVTTLPRHRRLIERWLADAEPTTANL